jgi:hypothetical protein
MTRNNAVIGIVVAMTVAIIITGSTIPMVLAQQNGNMTNMTGGGGDLLKKLLSAGIKAKTIQAVINNKDIFVVACDPGFTDPATQCDVYTTQPVEQQ